MSISRIDIEREFRRINLGTNLDQIRELADRVQADRLTSVTSQLGVEIGQLRGGFQALTAELDDVLPQLSFSIPAQLTNRVGIAQMTAQVPQLADRLITSVGAAANDLASITETANIDTSMINVVISGTTPEAIAASLGEVIPQAAAAIGEVAEVAVPELTSVMENIVNVNIPFSEAITQVETALAGISIPTLASQQLPAIQEALQQAAPALQNITNIADQFAEEVLPSLSFGSLNSIATQASSQANRVLDANLGLFNDIATNATTVLNSVNLGFSGILSNVIEAVEGPALSVVTRLATRDGIALTVPSNVLTNIRSLVNTRDFNQAARLLQSFSGTPLNEIEDALRGINNNLSANLSVPSTGGFSIPATNIGSSEGSWNEADTPPEAFSFVATHEELEVELKSVDREITEVIVDWTRTHTNQNLGAEDFQEVNAAFGLSVAHHYFIKRDGSLQRGRPINVLGPRIVNGHNRYAVLVALVGGINSPSGVPNEEIERYLSADSYTTAQMNTFKVFMQKVYSAWPGVQALGLNEVDRAQRAPGFIVSDYTADNFDKAKLYTDSYTEQSYNRTTLISTRLPNFDYNNYVPSSGTSSGAR